MPTSSHCNTLRAWIRLSLEPELKPAMLRKLLAHAGSADRVYSLSQGSLAALVGATLATQMRAPAPSELAGAIEAALAWAADPAHSLLTLDDAAYPALLLEIHDPPPLLYVVGDPACLSRPAVAIVGARNATPGGLDNARAFARTLARMGWCVVSGLAAGIDAAAHEGALEAGQDGAGTVAVMGTGADIIYPARNRALASRIATHGALVSEYALGMPALPHQFPRRNRLVAGLTRGVLIVEAAVQSGSLITARLAADAGREVFAIPGSIHSPLSRGCHALLRQGAKLTETAHDIVSELGAMPAGAQASGDLFDGGRRMVQSYEVCLPAATPGGCSGAACGADLSAPGATRQTCAAASLMQALGHDPVHLDDLQRRLQWPAQAVLSGLLALELDNRVARLPGGRYQRR